MNGPARWLCPGEVMFRQIPRHAGLELPSDHASERPKVDLLAPPRLFVEIERQVFHAERQSCLDRRSP